ncbi:TIGR03067 domain-containing protein [Salinicola corii]|uniref:TIGR03067 domain-containing protein n=1 Tax=Salinicola corii TaxID=2606937 RepID=UPI003B84A8C5
MSTTLFTVRTRDGTVLIEGSFEIDPSKHPKRITWIDSMGPDAGKRLPAIYNIDDDRFRFIAADEGQPWPTEFKTVPGLTMRSFRRHGRINN